MKYGFVYMVEVKRIFKNSIDTYIRNIYTSREMAYHSLFDMANDCINDEVAKGTLLPNDIFKGADLVIKYAEGGQWGEECTCIYRIKSEMIFTEDENIEWKEAEYGKNIL